jgi:hypothetical protein
VGFKYIFLMVCMHNNSTQHQAYAAAPVAEAAGGEEEEGEVESKPSGLTFAQWKEANPGVIMSYSGELADFFWL